MARGCTKPASSGRPGGTPRQAKQKLHVAKPSKRTELQPKRRRRRGAEQSPVLDKKRADLRTSARARKNSQ